MARALGKGLSSLIAERPELEAVAANAPVTQTVEHIALKNIAAGMAQPRKHFDDESLKELADSISHNGVVQPILLRKTDSGYEIIAGERRFRASQLANKVSIPALVQRFSDIQAFEIGLIENIQREDLAPLEVAEGYQRLIQEFSYTQEKLASVVGKSRSAVTNQLRLLGLPDPVKNLLNEGKISAGHAKVLLGTDNAETLAKEVYKHGLSVRQLEARIKEGETAPKKPVAAQPKSQIIRDIEETLSHALATKVRLSDKEGTGKLVIEYARTEVLNDIVKRLSAKGY